MLIFAAKLWSENISMVKRLMLVIQLIVIDKLNCHSNFRQGISVRISWMSNLQWQGQTWYLLTKQRALICSLYEILANCSGCMMQTFFFNWKFCAKIFKVLIFIWGQNLVVLQGDWLMSFNWRELVCDSRGDWGWFTQV